MDRPRSNNDWQGDRVDEDAGPLVRPYLATEGRTEATVKLDRLTLVRSTGTHRLAVVGDHQAEVLALCQETRSVQELSAHLRFPVAVIMVLLSDLIEIGAVQQNPPTVYNNDEPDYDLLQRIHDGLLRKFAAHPVPPPVRSSL